MEFDAKISVSKVGRFAFLDRLSWDSYNENADLKPVVEQYRERYGSYPESVHVDATIEHGRTVAPAVSAASRLHA